MRRLRRRPFGEEEDVWSLELGLGTDTSGDTEKCERDLLSPESYRRIVLAAGCSHISAWWLCDENVLSVQPSPFGACQDRGPHNNLVFLGGVISLCFTQKTSTLILVIEAHLGNFYSRALPARFKEAIMCNVPSSICSNRRHACCRRQSIFSDLRYP